MASLLECLQLYAHTGGWICRSTDARCCESCTRYFVETGKPFPRPPYAERVGLTNTISRFPCTACMARELLLTGRYKCLSRCSDVPTTGLPSLPQTDARKGDPEGAQLESHQAGYRLRVFLTGSDGPFEPDPLEDAAVAAIGPREAAFEARRAGLRAFLGPRTGGEVVVVAVGRESVLEDLQRHAHALDIYTPRAGIDDRPRPVRVTVEGAEALAEVLAMAARELLAEDTTFFETVDDGVHPRQSVNRRGDRPLDSTDYFILCGQLTGLALRGGRAFPLRLSRPMLRNVFAPNRIPRDPRKWPSSGKDQLADVDPALQRDTLELRALAPEEVASRKLTFAVQEGADKRRRVNLVAGGSEKPVTAENLDWYLATRSYQRLVLSVRSQLELFVQGLNGVIYDEVRSAIGRSFSVEEIRALLLGLEPAP